MLNKMKVRIIGMGSMGSALARGIARNAEFDVCGFDRTPEKVRQALGETATIFEDLVSVVAGSDIVLLCVKPDGIINVLRAISPALVQKQIVISVAAGVSLQALRDACTHPLMARAMPNTGAAFGDSTTSLVFSDEFKATEKHNVERLFECVGLTKVLAEESQMHAALALAGSGPAFFLYLADAMSQAGEELGLSKGDAEFFARGAVRAASALLSKGDISISANEHIRRIASPGGTTQEGLGELGKQNTARAFAEAVNVTARKSRQMETRETK